MRRSKVRALRRRVAPWARGAALGAVVGSRSMLVPALISRTSRGAASRVLPVVAAMEMAADKTPWIPSRTAPLSLAGRVLLGAAVAFGAASSRRGWRRRPTLTERVGIALVGGSLAAASAFLLRALRARVSRRARAAGALAGLLEDLAAIGAGRALTHA